MDSVSARTFDVIDPYTGKVWAKVPRGNEEDVDYAVTEAARAFDSPEWNGMNPSERGYLIHRLGDLIKENADRLARIESMQNGKLYREMLGQLQGMPHYYYYFGGFADKISGEVVPPVKKNLLIYTVREAIGVVAAVMPWNSPLLLLTFKLAPGLAAGNTFVVKPSKYTPVSTLELAKLGEKAGFPPGVINVVTGFSNEVGDPLIKHPKVGKIAFTGSTETGKEIAKMAAFNLRRVTLELGGKSPNIVFEDAEIDKAVNGVVAGIFAATGQTCIAGSRLLAHEDIYDELLRRLVQKAKTIKMGDPLDTSTEMGPVAFREQLEKIRTYVELARKEGAVVLTGGSQPEWSSSGLFFEPTILANVNNNMRVAREEIFGPVLCAMKFKDEEEAIRIANDTEFGLAAGIWTRDVRRAHRVASRLRAGTIWVNTYRVLSYAAPFGGFKNSGIGRENGFDVIKEYTQSKSIYVELAGESRDPFKLG